MPVPVPNLDDRTFADLVAEGRAMIPRLSPVWTNHNPSDPGITLLELLAWLTEALLYDLNQVRSDSYLTFLELIGITPAAGESLDQTIERAVRSLASRTRTASQGDFEALAFELGAGRVFGSRAVADVNLERTSPTGEGHVSLVVLPSAALLGLVDPASRTRAALEAAMTGPAVTALLADLRAALGARLLVTTRLHVVPPAFVPLVVGVRLVGRSDAGPSRLKSDAELALRAFLDPYLGGDAGGGWPFGRAVYRSELMQTLERVPGVDHVEELLVNDDPTDNPIVLEAHQLAGLDAVNVDVVFEDGP